MKINISLDPYANFVKILSNKFFCGPLYLNLDLKFLASKFRDNYSKAFPWHLKDCERSLLTPDISNPLYEFSYYSRIHESTDFESFIAAIKRNAGNAILSTWRRQDYANDNQRKPCLLILSAKLREGFLDFSVVFRKRDIIRRMPGNWFALYKLQQEISTQLGSTPGYLHDYSMDWFYQQQDLEKLRQFKVI